MAVVSFNFSQVFVIIIPEADTVFNTTLTLDSFHLLSIFLIVLEEAISTPKILLLLLLKWEARLFKILNQ